MDAGPTRWVIVDDTSSDIRYSDGPWFSDVGTWDSVGFSGIPYMRTLHGTNSNATVKFDFTGSAVAVVGSNVGSKSNYWTCSVDGVAAENDAGSLAPICTSHCNNYLICYATGLEDGNHTLTVNATPAGNQTFWLDRIEYVPSHQVSLEQKAIRVTSSDSALVGLKTKSFTFYGVSVSWYGRLTNAYDASAANFSWSMDQADANYTWDLKGNLNASYPLLNQKFFETPIYPIGEHTLTVMDTVGFGYLIVQNGTAPTRSPTGSYSSIGLTDATPRAVGMSRAVESGVIAGGVIGGVVVFCLAVLVFCFCRRRLRSQQRTKIHWDALFFDQKPTPHPLPLPLSLSTSLSPQSYPVERKSRTLTSYSPITNSLPSNTNSLPPNTASHPPSSRSHMHGTKSTNGSSLKSRSTRHTETGSHGRQPQSMPSSAQPIVAVDVGQDIHDLPVPRHLRVDTRPNSGFRSNGQALAASVIHLPPEYTPN